MDRLHTEVSHLNQLRKSHVSIDRGHDLPGLQKLLAETEHFVFTSVPEADDDIRASADAMKEADVWHLPHPVCTFEFNAILTLAGTIKYPCERLILLCIEHPAHGPLAPYFFVRGNDRHRWIAVSYRPGDDTADPDEDVTVEVAIQRAMTAGRLDGWRDGMESSVQIQNFADKDRISTGQSLQDAAAACLVALFTKGIRRERMVGDKVLLKGRKEPKDAYTRVLVAECLQSGDASPSASGERNRVRLHLRRGHIREQPHGPGRKYVRKIWIQQQLVGYVEEGRITHDHYEHYPAEAHA